MIRPPAFVFAALAMAVAVYATLDSSRSGETRTASGSSTSDESPDALDSAWASEETDAGPPRRWLFRDCGLGYSGPVVAGGKLYIMGSRDGVERLLAVDAVTGDELWATDLGEEYENGWGNGPRGTPVIDGPRVYALAARGNLVCLNLADGAELWRASLTQLGGEVPAWGYSETPLVDGDLVLVTPGGERGAVAALDKLTGEVVWRSTDVTDGAHYSSIVTAEPHGKQQYVQLMPNQLVGLATDTGELLWQVDWPGKVAVIPTPIVRDNQVYVTSGYGVGCMLVELSEEMEATKVYENKVMKNHHGGVAPFGDHLYGHSDGVGWVCQEFATGERVWRERSALGKGAVTLAGGLLYCLSEDEGELVVVEPSPEGWQEQSRFTLDPQTELRKPKGKIWTHPVIADGRLYLRDQELLFCFDVATE